MILDHAAEAWRTRHHRSPRGDGAGLAFCGRLTRALARLPWEHQAAARELLFEIVHEKSLPFTPTVIQAEVKRPVHAEKLRTKLAAGFHGRFGSCTGAALEAGQHHLAALTLALLP